MYQTLRGKYLEVTFEQLDRDDNTNVPQNERNTHYRTLLSVSGRVPFQRVTFFTTTVLLAFGSALLGDAGVWTSVFDWFDLSRGMNHIYEAPESVSDTENKVLFQ